MLCSMRTLIDFSLLQEYSDEVEPRGDKLLVLAKLIYWDAFQQFGNDLYKNQTACGQPT